MSLARRHREDDAVELLEERPAKPDDVDGARCWCGCGRSRVIRAARKPRPTELGKRCRRAIRARGSRSARARDRARVRAGARGVRHARRRRAGERRGAARRGDARGALGRGRRGAAAARRGGAARREGRRRRGTRSGSRGSRRATRPRRTARTARVARSIRRADCWLGLATVAAKPATRRRRSPAYDALCRLSGVERAARGADAPSSCHVASYELGRAWALAKLGRNAEAKALDRAEELGARSAGRRARARVARGARRRLTGEGSRAHLGRHGRGRRGQGD